MSTFSGINSAARALSAAQLGIETTGQNIANVNTEGYSRQRVEQTSSTLNETGQYARNHVPGDGVTVTGLTRIADQLAVNTARQDAASSSEQGATSAVWSNIENVLGDTGTTGLSQNLTALSSAFNDLSNAGPSTSDAANALVLSRAGAVTDKVNSMRDQLTAQSTALTGQADQIVAQANVTANSIAKLNTSIRQTLATGSSANELMDQRDQYLSTLANLTGARAVNREDGSVDVYVGNATLVTGDKALALTTSTISPLSLSVNGIAATPASGSLKATLDGVNTTIPKQVAALDAFSAGLSNVKDANGDSLFTVTGGVVSTASSFVDSTTGTSDRAFAKSAVTALTTSQTAWRGLSDNVSSAAQSADNRATLASQVSLKSAAARDAVSGVNLDEEMTNLVAYQHAYSAAARVLSAIDQSLDTLLSIVR